MMLVLRFTLALSICVAGALTPARSAVEADEGGGGSSARNATPIPLDRATTVKGLGTID